MKSQKKKKSPKSLASITEVDMFNSSKESFSGGGTMLASSFDIVDFKLISSNPANPGQIYDYTELHLDSVGCGGTVPIKTQDDPERVMFVSGLPPVGADWSMTLILNKGEFSDSLKLKCVAGVYAQMRVDLGDQFQVIHEEPEVFFTIKLGDQSFETYVNVNMASAVAQVRHGNPTTFDVFGMSLLGRSNTPDA
jgi:hypothetical protein